MTETENTSGPSDFRRVTLAAGAGSGPARVQFSEESLEDALRREELYLTAREDEDFQLLPPHLMTGEERGFIERAATDEAGKALVAAVYEQFCRDHGTLQEREQRRLAEQHRGASGPERDGW